MQGTDGIMRGKTVLVTGGTSGIGKATAVALAGMGAEEVVIVGRNKEKGERSVKEIRQQTGNENISLLLADLAEQSQVRRLAAGFGEHHDRLDVLVNNAGAILSKRSTTPDGLETTFAVNHLAPFLLTNLLLGLLKKSAPSRVVTVASEAERFGERGFLDDLQSEKRYGSMRAYGRSKLANIAFTFELAERLEGTGVTATCMHPGAVNTGFGTNNRDLFSRAFGLFRPFMRTPEEGADTLIYLASSPDVEGMTGKYLSDRKVLVPSAPAYDPEVRRRLWEESERLVGMKVAA